MMTSKATWRMAVRIGLLAGLAMMSFGCDLNKPEAEKDNQAESGRKKTSYNLKYVACPHNPDKTVEVEIKSGNIAPVDQYIFLCKGDKVLWFTDEDNLKFTVQFDDTAAATTNGLFESGQAKFPSKPDKASDKKGHKQVTDIQSVGVNATPYQDYSYKVLPTDKNGKTVSTNDPHVIPM